MTETRDLLEEIYRGLDRAEALAELEPRDKGGYYLLTCPSCRKREAYIYKDGTRIICNRRDKCGFSQSLWDYVQGSRRLTNQETLRELAQLAGYSLPELDKEALERIERAREQASVWESSLDYFKAQLKEEKGRAVLDYLKGRGYLEKEIEAMELGLFTSTKELKAYLVSKGHKEDVIAPVIQSLENISKEHKVVIPYRDPIGRVKGFIVRAIKEDVERKYLYNKGLTRDAPFNLDRARGHSELIIVEGSLDALAVREKAGLENVIALGDTSLSEAKLDQALKYGARAFILALDNDKAGAEGTERALELLRKRNIRGYVVTLPEGIKDPDELIKTKGPGAFVELSRNPESGARWKAGRLLARYDTETDKGRDLALEEAIAYEDGLRDPIESKDFLDVITGGLGLSLELLEHRLKTYKEKRAREELRKGYQELFKRGPELLEAGDLEGLSEYTGEKSRELQAKAITRTLGLYRLENLEEDIAQTRPGLKTGYDSLDKVFLIPPEAITIIGARPSHGKTTLLMNLALNMTGLYPDRSFFFFSYEESRKQVGVKLLNILSGEIIDKVQNVRALEDYLRAGSRPARVGIEAGKAKFKELTESKRLWIIDEPFFVDELADTLAQLKERYNVGAIFIDYIQKIKIKSRYPTRQVELQKISERILETAKGLSIPIILGAQLGRDPQHSDKVRLDNLREAGDIEQDANLVLGLYNETMDKAQESGEFIKGDEVELKVTVLKNRNGPVNEERALTFNRPLLTIKEKAGSWK
jgi:DNA primase catalytic core